MGYRVSKNWNNPSLWRIIWRKYTGNVAKERHIPETEYGRIGILKSMTIDEVRAILKKINLEENRTQLEDKRNAIVLRMVADKQIECVHLPVPFVEKFETEHLETRYIGNDARLKKVLKLWRASQKIIRTIKISTDKWHRYPEHFYAYFEKNAMSPGYAKNLLSTINMWLDFLGMEQDKHYRPIPAANNVWQSRINTAFEDANKGKASLPITPHMLANAKPAFTPAQHNWIYCTVWAGLRPSEASALLNKKRTQVKYVDGTPVLRVYQSKLKNIPKVEDRWKLIPLFLPEQLTILKIIESGSIEEPLSKTLASRFGEGHSLYGGRKGFHELMVTSYAQPELEVVRWLGHRSLDMAMKHYAKKDAVRWTPLKKVS